LDKSQNCPCILYYVYKHGKIFIFLGFALLRHIEECEFAFRFVVGIVPIAVYYNTVHLYSARGEKLIKFASRPRGIIFFRARPVFTESPWNPGNFSKPTMRVVRPVSSINSVYFDHIRVCAHANHGIRTVYNNMHVRVDVTMARRKSSFH